MKNLPSAARLRRLAQDPLQTVIRALQSASGLYRSHQDIRDLRRKIADLRGSDTRRSVVFLHHNFYNFYYLAAALRRRGWTALSVSMEAPDHPDQLYFHGEDINLYAEDPVTFAKKITYFYNFVHESIAMVHVGQVGRLTFYPNNMDGTYFRERIPWDFLVLKKSGVKIGYTHHGCCDLVSQTSFYRWSRGMCDKCAWQNRPHLCSDLRNLAWGHTVQLVADLICIETDPMLDFKAHPNVYREPLTFAMDPDVWRPDLLIPEELRVIREPGEVIIMHTVGNSDQRWRDAHTNAKGSSAVFNAVRRLAARGYKVRLLFHDKLSNIKLRFIQAQADIIVDQLLYGRYGATARESMMLGKPTVAHINPREELSGAESQCILETPIIDATEDTIESVLEDLVRSPEKRVKIGQASRQHALKWWSADSCAERYEEVYDRIMRGERPMEKVVAPFQMPLLGPRTSEA